MARQRKKMLAAGTTGTRRIIRPSLRNGFNGCFAFSLVRRACWPPCAQCAYAHYAGYQHRDIGTARLDRACIAVRPPSMNYAAATHAHRIPLPTIRDGRETPLMRQQGRADVKVICPTAQALLLRQTGTTGSLEIGGMRAEDSSTTSRSYVPKN